MPGIFGGSSQPTQQAPAVFSQGGNPAAYIPQGQPQQDTNFQNVLNQLASQGQLNLNSYLPQINQNTQSGINAASGVQGGFGPALFGQGSSNALAMGGAVPQILASGFDPQSSLFDSESNKVLQAANAANASAGVSGPYAATTINDAMSNFENQWQNQQLKRQLAGIQGAGVAGQAGESLGGSAIANYLASQGGAGNQAIASGLGTQASAFGLPQQLAQDIESYLGLGQSASALGGQLGNLGFNQGAASSLGLAQLAGLGGNFLTGNQGLSGALGLTPQGGLLGPGGVSGLFGPGLSSGEAGAASGFGGAFGGAIPAAVGTGDASEALDLGTLLFG